MSILKSTILTAAFALIVVAPTAQSANYPERSIRLIIPYTPAGGADILGRLAADNAQKSLGQPIVVENKPGANTMLATNYAAKEKNDGYTLLYTSSSFTINPHIYETQYDPASTFEPVALLSEIPLVLVTTADSPVSSVQELIDAARESPDKLSYGSYGMGSAGHLAGALFESMGDVEMLHIPYRGSAPALNDLMGDHIDIAIVSLESARDMVTNGMVRPLAIFNESRLPSMPDIPTVQETVPGCVTVGWNGVVAPKGTPEEIIDILNASFNEALSSDRMRQFFSAQGLTPNPQSPEALVNIINADNQRWANLVRDTGLTVE